jgi:phosphatidylglycerol:prolipoprotein diacylglycerol transferase
VLQTLFVIPKEIAGAPVFGFGWLLAVWAVVGLVMLAWLVWRYGFTGEVLGYIPLLVLVGAAIMWLLPALCKGGGLPIRSYGVMLLVAVLSATALTVRRARRVGLEADLILSLAFWLFVPGIVGARLFYIIEYWSAYQRATLRESLAAAVNITEGGLVVYGSLIGAMVGLVWFVRKNRLPALPICDLIAPSIMLGLAIGRIGCLLNGCCFGGTCDLPWAITFPPGSPPYESQVARGWMVGMRYVVDPETHQLVVGRVDPDSPADKAGLKRGDHVVRVNDDDVPTIGRLERVLHDTFHARQPVVIETALGRRVEIPAGPLPARSLPVHPAQPYATINALLICLLLLAYAPFRRRDGELFALLLTIYPVTRFLLEIIRTDESAVFGIGLTISQSLSLLMLPAVGVLWFYILRQPRRTAFATGQRAGH